MAFKMGNLRSMVGQLRGGRKSFATWTIPKMKPIALEAEQVHHANNAHTASPAKFGEWAPIQITLGMVGVAMALGAHTALQQLARSPSVHVNKKKRESVPEVYQPDQTIDNADRFINHSMLRKVAHIQDNKKTLSDPAHPNPFSFRRTAYTLKTAGVEPGRI